RRGDRRGRFRGHRHPLRGIGGSHVRPPSGRRGLRRALPRAARATPARRWLGDTPVSTDPVIDRLEGVTTRSRILESAALEIERNGLTLFRVKRVASEADISVALLYSYFTDREDLIAATLVYRFEQVLLGQAEIFTTPLRDVNTADELRAGLNIMIADAQDPARD